MKGIIIYASKTGVTQEIAEKINTLLNEKFQMVNLELEKAPDLSSFEKVVIGSYMRMGRVGEMMSGFLENHKKMLVEKRPFIFISAAKVGEEHEREVKSSIPKEIYDVATIRNLGTRYSENLNFAEKMALKEIAKREGKFVEQLNPMDDEKIAKFVTEIQSS